jgi:hypothetical protein
MDTIEHKPDSIMGPMDTPKPATTTDSIDSAKLEATATLDPVDTAELKVVPTTESEEISEVEVVATIDSMDVMEPAEVVESMDTLTLEVDAMMDTTTDFKAVFTTDSEETTEVEAVAIVDSMDVDPIDVTKPVDTMDPTDTKEFKDITTDPAETTNGEAVAPPTEPTVAMEDPTTMQALADAVATIKAVVPEMNLKSIYDLPPHKRACLPINPNSPNYLPPHLRALNPELAFTLSYDQPIQYGRTSTSELQASTAHMTVIPAGPTATLAFGGQSLIEVPIDGLEGKAVSIIPTIPKRA